MSNYIKATNFATKDALTTGNPLKTLSGTELDDEYTNIATAVATKANTSSPTLTGTPAAPTAATANNSTQIATTAFAQAAIVAGVAAVTASDALKAPLASPALTGTPTAPTASVSTNTTQVATTAYVMAASPTLGIVGVKIDSDAVLTGRTLYVNNGAATGGSNGDIWFEY